HQLESRGQQAGIPFGVPWEDSDSSLLHVRRDGPHSLACGPVPGANHISPTLASCSVSPLPPSYKDPCDAPGPTQTRARKRTGWHIPVRVTLQSCCAQWDLEAQYIPSSACLITLSICDYDSCTEKQK
ncbi:hypothetical protein H1C71_018389, partial [Ictidomys tridecemlineatus]